MHNCTLNSASPNSNRKTQTSRLEFGCRGYRHKVGLLLAQLGTPDEPTPKAVRRYLAQFLADRRVIEVNRVVWWLILNGIILRLRPRRSARLYRRIWTEQGSPLLTITKEQCHLVKQLVDQEQLNVKVVFGMRYGQPSLEQAVRELQEAGCDRVVLLPMYPQYAGATTGSTYDAIFDAFKKLRWVPTLRVVEPYFVHPAYLKALAHSINTQLAALERQPEYLLFSFHGIPFAYVDRGDPYCCMCSETAQFIKPMINFPEERIIQTYQSRFGRDPWLEPYTDETIKRLAHEGVKRIAVACPGFTADCLETLDEIGNEGQEAFHEAGGEELINLSCVNTETPWIDALFQLFKSNAGPDWLTECEKPYTNYECPVKLHLKQASK